MITTEVDLLDTMQTVTRPVVIGVLEDMKKWLKLPKDVKIIFPGDMERLMSNNSNLTADENLAVFTEKDQLRVTIQEIPIQEQLLTTAHSEYSAGPIFMDKNINAQVKPIYVQTKLTINIEATYGTRTEAISWFQSMLTKISRSMDLHLHNLKYHFVFPAAVKYLIRTLYTYQENKYPYGRSIDEYLQDTLHPRTNITSDNGGFNKEIVLNEEQRRIVGYLENDPIPEKAVREEAGVYTAQFSYTFSYEKPVSCYLIYPISIHQQLLPHAFVDHVLEYYPSQFDGYYQDQLFGLSTFDLTIAGDRHHERQHCFHLPPEDIFIPNNYYNWIVPIVTALVFLEEDNSLKINLTDLGLVGLDDDILDFIKNSESAYIGSPYESMINVTFYENDKIMPGDLLKANRNGDVYYEGSLDPRKEYRIVIGICTSPAMLPSFFYDRLKQYPRAFVKLLMAVNEYLDDYPYLKEIYGSEAFKDHQINELYRWFYSINVRRRLDKLSIDPRKFKPKLETKELFTPMGGHTVMTTSLIVSGNKNSYYDNSDIHPLFYLR